MFYGSHLDVVSRRLTGSVASEMAYTLELLDRHPGGSAPGSCKWRNASSTSTLRMEPGVMLPSTKWTNVLGPMDDDLAQALAQNVAPAVHHGLAVRAPLGADPRAIAQRRGEVVVPRKRLYATTIYIFLLWIVGTAAAAVRHRRAVHAQSGPRDPAPRPRRRGVRHGPRHRRRSSRRAPPRCAARPTPSTACRSASAASWCSGPRCWPASRTTCARR